MSTQYLTDTLFRPYRRNTARRLQASYRNVIKEIRVARVRSFRAVKRWRADQYYVSHAIYDVRFGLQANQDIIIGAILTFSMVLYASVIVGTQIMYILFENGIAAAESSGIPVIILMACCAGVLAVLCLWVSAFGVASLSVALLQSLHRKHYRSLLATLRAGLRLSQRLSWNWIVLAILYLAPAVIAGVVVLETILFGLVTFEQALATSPYLIVSWLVWFCGVSMNYVLAPTVAIHEPKLTTAQTFTRSAQLVQRRGRVFQLFFSLALISFGIGAYLITLYLDRLIGLPYEVSLAFCMFGIGILGAWVQTALYRKRMRARTR